MFDMGWPYGAPDNDDDYVDAYFSASNAEYQSPIYKPAGREAVKLTFATPDDWLDTYLWIQEIPLKEIKSC